MPGERPNRRHVGRGAAADRLPPLNAENNPGNARWCEQHQRLECVKKGRSRNAAVCHQDAMRGTDTCKVHGGVPSREVRMKGEAQITAWSAINRTDGGVAAGANLDPGMAVLGMLQMSWLRVAAYGELLRKQVELESSRRAELESGLAPVIDEDGDPVGEGMIDVQGLIGHRMSATNDGSLYASSEEVRALVLLEERERDRCVNYAEKAHKMGISERMTAQAEKWSDVVAGRVVNMLDDLGLTAAQQKRLPMLMQMHLGDIDVTGGQQ